MSLEQALQENTAAIRELIAAYKGGAPVRTVASDAKASEPTKAMKEGAEVHKTAEAAYQSAAQTEAATYKQASDAILALVKECGRDSALKVISAAQEGAGKLPEVAAENWGKVIAGANAAIAAKKGAA